MVTHSHITLERNRGGLDTVPRRHLPEAPAVALCPRGGLDPVQLTSMVAGIDASCAKAHSPDDLLRIRAQIASHHGDLDTFSARLRARLLLDPLDYQVRDVLRRAGRIFWLRSPGSPSYTIHRRIVIVGIGVGADLNLHATCGQGVVRSAGVLHVVWSLARSA
jgi:hypothetical protein